MNHIHIIPFAGLCNRMRAMASGVTIAQNYGYPTSIYWNNTPGLKADFSQLFVPIKLPNIKMEENRKWLFDIGYTRDYLLRWPLLKCKYQTLYNFSIQDHPDISQHISPNRKKDLLLISCFSMANHYPINRLFVPQISIMHGIQSIVETYSRNTIGIHIRRTDNKEAISKSPLEAFTAMMDNEIRKDELVKFFVASDNEDTKNFLRARYPERIISLNQKADRNSLAGMQNAVTELFCLSKTKKIIGSCYSSFSEIAAELGGIELIRAK